MSEPAFGAGLPAAGAAAPEAGYSVGGPGDHHRVAQAGHAAARANEAGQKLHQGAGTAKGKRQEELARLVAEENESRSKFPRYPGLERWELVEKMGDGAFSNVYRARDREGKTGEVAIKVVRKYEMNSMQVSCAGKTLLLGPGRRPLLHPSPPFMPLLSCPLLSSPV